MGRLMQGFMNPGGVTEKEATEDAHTILQFYVQKYGKDMALQLAARDLAICRMTGSQLAQIVDHQRRMLEDASEEIRKLRSKIR